VDKHITDIRFRKTKTKWGHCTSKGVLQYNWLIMLAPNSVIDYMISHEVCHLKHMDHSKRFWSLVDSVCPNSDRFIDWLREHEHRLYF
jgi:predicted metal-dependent hydrolase